MRCFYLNLDRATERRDTLERNFAGNTGIGWSLTRFAAFDTAYVEEAKVPGVLRPAEKACFLSHRELIRQNLSHSDPIFLLEDDAIFGRRSAQVIDGLLEPASAPEFDLLYTDVLIPGPSEMAELLRIRRLLEQTGEVISFDLRSFSFCGATAYIVNGASKAKLYSLLAEFVDLDVPYDLVLRQFIRQGALAARCLFPFQTSISELAQCSQIQPAEAETTTVIWNLFRQMIWAERNLEEHHELLQQLDHTMCDEESRAFATLFASMCSPKFKTK